MLKKMVRFKVFSLKHLCLIRIVTSFWQEIHLKKYVKDIKIMLKEKNGVRGKNDNVLNIVIEKKIMELTLPEHLKKELLSYVKPIGENLLSWIYQNYYEFKCSKFIPDEIYWANNGTVDVEKTAKVLLKDPSLSETERYRLACCYCFRDYVAVFWNKLGVGQRLASTFTNISHNQGILLMHWSMVDKVNVGPVFLHQNYLNFEDFCRRGIQLGAYYYNEPATRFFVKNSSHLVKKEVLPKTLEIFTKIKPKKEKQKHVYYDIFYDLFTAMTDEQQIETVKKLENDALFKFKLLRCYLNWPRQSSFMEIFNLVFKTPTDFVLTKVTELIFTKVEQGFRDYDYLQICRQLWCKVPDYKKVMINQLKLNNRFRLWLILLEAEDKRTIWYVMKCANGEDRQQIFTNHRDIIEILLVKKGKWDFLKFFLGLCDLPKEILLEWKETYKVNLDDEGKETFFRIVDDLAATASSTWLFSI